MGEKDKRRYACGVFPPVGNIYIQQGSDLIIDDIVEELRTISTSMLKQKMRNIDNLLDASTAFYYRQKILMRQKIKCRGHRLRQICLQKIGCLWSSA